MTSVEMPADSMDEGQDVMEKAGAEAPVAAVWTDLERLEAPADDQETLGLDRYFNPSSGGRLLSSVGHGVVPGRMYRSTSAYNPRITLVS